MTSRRSKSSPLDGTGDDAGAIVAVVHFPASDEPPERAPFDATHYTGAPSELQFAAFLLARMRQRGDVAVAMRADGTLESDVPDAAEAAGAAFPASYLPVQLYSPDGRARAIARDLAAALGGQYEPVYRAGDEPGDYERTDPEIVY